MTRRNIPIANTGACDAPCTSLVRSRQMHARARTHTHAQEKTHTCTMASNPFFGFVSDLSPFFRSKARPAHAAPVRRQTRMALIRHHIQHALAALCTNLPPSRAHRRKPVRPQPLALFLRPPSASCAARGVGSPSSAAAGSTSAAAVPALLLLLDWVAGK